MIEVRGGGGPEEIILNISIVWSNRTMFGTSDTRFLRKKKKSFSIHRVFKGKTTDKVFCKHKENNKEYV